MGRLDRMAESGIVIALACGVAALPVLLDARAVVGPIWLWWTLFGAYSLLLAVLTTGRGDRLDQRQLTATLLGLAAVGAVVVLLSPAVGWTSVLLVVTVAICAERAGRRLTGAVVAGNTLVAGLMVYLASSGDALRSTLPVAGLTMLIMLFLQLLSVLWGVGMQREVGARRQLAVAHAELRAASALLAESSRAAERLRIARDLHDTVGHQLTALALELEVASHRSSPPATEHVARARRIAKDLLADVRAAVGELRESAPELRSTLTGIVADLPRPRVHLDVADDLAVDDELATALVHGVREIVTNAIRHADADNLWLTITTADGSVAFHAQDDGGGARELRPGNGLRGLRERFEALGGEVSVDPAPPGFSLDARVPAA